MKGKVIGGDVTKDVGRGGLSGLQIGLHLEAAGVGLLLEMEWRQ